MLTQKTPSSFDVPRLTIGSCLPPRRHSQMVLVVAFCGRAWGLGGKTMGSRKAEGGAPHSHILLAQSPTIGPMQAEVIIWEILEITVIFLSVPDSYTIQNYPHWHVSQGEKLLQIVPSTGGKRVDLYGSFLPSTQQLVEQDHPGRFLIIWSLIVQPIYFFSPHLPHE